MFRPSSGRYIVNGLSVIMGLPVQNCQSSICKNGELSTQCRLRAVHCVGLEKTATSGPGYTLNIETALPVAVRHSVVGVTSRRRRRAARGYAPYGGNEKVYC